MADRRTDISIFLKRKIRISITAQSLIDFSMIAFFSNSFFRLIFSKVLIGMRTNVLLQVAIDLLIYVPLFLGIFLEIKKGKRVNISFLAILLVVGMFFQLTLVLHPSYSYWYERETYGVWDTVFRLDKGGIYGFLFFSLIKNDERIYKNLKYIAFLNYIVIIYKFLQYLSNGYWTEMSYTGDYVSSSYSLDYGYNAIMIFILMVAFYFYEKKKVYLLLGVPAFILVILFGSRGPLLVVLVFFVGNVARYILKSDNMKKMLYLSLILTLSLLAVVSFDYIVAFMIERLSELNISSKIILALTTNNLFDDSGRSDIAALISKFIDKGPLLGYGAYGDRPVIGPHYVWGYCHNIMLEFQVDFGKYPGIALLILMMAMTIKRTVNAHSEKNFIIILFIFAMCMKLSLSGTFWGDEFFWALLAINVCWGEKKFKIVRR